MNIYPAIDIYKGQGVRLMKGAFDAITVYGTPKALCKKWSDQGAKNLHVVDLNGAQQSGNNLELILELANTFDMNIQVGGGIRSIDQAEFLLKNQVDKVILGTSAITDKKMTQYLLNVYQERIIIGVDAKNGFVAIEGWAEVSEIPAITFVKELISMGANKIIYTDISKDGMMSGPNFEIYEALVELDVEIIASGGITTLDDLNRLKAIGVEGAILGKTLYENKLSLKEALAC